ncbi:Mitochondrial dynamics protein MID49 [Varanus komodoensis]|uniref:Mitochondrial elongation factor 2 n=1 Tax=Varanus komodoensis TaxID=61221 RepID=A0A8D2LWG8_VARKO|nr:mitochondrial dynamics protein MID49 [Varanus komodoensis]XP_044289363.1 mitochondrial dynamics protein MID49 [Varanus komodoensis]XP_044289364.1 mitochondrial dynamics protein MID49 [Varanus komodoensis]XP_044289365.1 mitochondrial dynamics protein MID49 [Varanus komodoensis]XP_044289366.1 mitochondrial dynamics protein MID49 [Varanus komodoensis]KAF7242992.1 Mitochondrial dynamics protein MID49 [Varanus komodoensis]
MADFSHKRGKRNDESGFGSLVDFLLANARVVLGVSGAAVLAIATLAVKKLIDRATSPPDDVDEIKAKQKSLEESWQELSLIKPVPKTRREDLEEPLISPVTAVATQEPESLAPSSKAPLWEPRPLLCSTLQEKLLSFYRDHVAAPEEDKALGKQLAKDICTELQNFLKNKSSELPFGTMLLCGYLCDDLASRGRLEVDFMLPLVLEPNLWHLIPGERTIINDPCFGMVKRTGVEFFPRGSSPWDRFLVGGYLSSNRVSDTLHKFLVASINWPVISSMLECAIRPVMAPKELKLEVRCERLHLDITLRPMIEAGGKILLAASSEEPVENLWQQSFYAAEMSKLKALDTADSGARRCCLGLLKVVFEGHPFWSKLAGRPLTHALLHLSQTELDWSEAALSERVQQVLEELVQYLAKGDLPCFFDSRINLFGHLPLEEMEEIGCTLYEALAAPDLANGLGL